MDRYKQADLARGCVGLAILLLGVWGLFVHMPTVLIPVAMIAGGAWMIQHYARKVLTT